MQEEVRMNRMKLIFYQTAFLTAFNVLKQL